MSESQPSPTPGAAVWLGYGGLVPFVCLALAALVGVHAQDVIHALLSYGAVILSFVGALHWAFAMTLIDPPIRRHALFAWSVVPALLAWVALLLAPVPAAALIVGGFLLHYRMDVMLARGGALPHWYLPLRLRLTVIACISVSIGGYAGRVTASPISGDNPVDILNPVTQTSREISRLCLLDEILTRLSA